MDITGKKAQSKLLVALGLVSFIATLDLTIVYTALPAIQQGLNTTVVKTQWIMNAFMISLATSMMIVGRLSDIHGQRRVLYIGIALFAVASLLGGLAQSIDQLIVVRVFQAIGIAILYIVPMAIVINVFPAEEQGRAYGLLIGIKGFGMAIGPALGGLLIGVLSWRWVFFINVPIILLGFAVLFRCLRGEDRINAPDEGVDLPSVALFVFAVAGVIFGLIQTDAWGWQAWQVWSIIVGALLSGVIFVQRQRHIKNPLINFDLFTIARFNLGLSVNFILAFSYCIILLIAPMYLEHVQDKSPVVLGLMLLPLSCMVALCSPMIGRWMGGVGSVNFVIIGFVLFALSMLMQTQFGVHTSVGFILLTYTVFGVGWACILSPSIMTALQAVPTEQSGVASGAVGTFHNVGGAFGLAVITLINNVHEGQVGLGEHILTTYHQGAMMLFGLIMFGIVLCLIMRPRRL